MGQKCLQGGWAWLSICLTKKNEGAYAQSIHRHRHLRTDLYAGGNVARIAWEALIGEDWVPLTWEERAYSATHRHVGSTFSNGKATDAVDMTTFG